MTEHRRDPMNPFRCICGVEHSNNYAISRHIAKMCNGRDGGEVMEDEAKKLSEYYAVYSDERGRMAYLIAMQLEEIDRLTRENNKIVECITCHKEYIHPSICPYCENAGLIDGLKAQLKRAITIAELLNVDEVCADTYWDMIKELQQMKGEIKE